MNTNKATRSDHRVVSRQEWLEARKAHLAREKELTRQRDELLRQRRELPWVKVDKAYAFEGPRGTQSLADLFGGRSQLVVYHFMFGPNAEQGCPSCSMAADGFDGSLAHLAQRDVALVAVSRAPYRRIEAFQQRMGWRFPWVSSQGNDFNRDHHVTFTAEDKAAGKVLYNYGLSDMREHPGEEAHGISVFYRDERGDVFHTYSAYARGCEPLLGPYVYLDMVPKGRDEEGLPFPMAWVRHHDRYADDPTGAGAERR